MNIHNQSNISVNEYGDLINAKLANINTLIRKHTAFGGVLGLVKSSRHPYTPLLKTIGKSKDAKELAIIADFYDAMMKRMGIDKVAYRF
jgi:hypothetical protein